MNNNTIQSLIYNQLYAAAMYNYIASLTEDLEQKKLLLSFEADSYNNARYLETYYETMNTSSFNPILSQNEELETFDGSLLWMIEYNGVSSRLFINQIYNDKNDKNIQKVTSYINEIINQHTTLLIHMFLQQNFYIKKTSPK